MSCTWLSVLHPPAWASDRYHEILADEKKNGLSLASKEIEKVLPLARETLDEVKALTEYEDQKANRILTAMAFLSALAGILFSEISKNAFPPGSTDLQCDVICLQAVGFALSKALFYGYVMFVAVGAFYTLWAVAPRFRVPKEWGRGTKDVQSPLFYAKIVESDPRKWMRFHYGKTTREIQEAYFEAYIYESYLIAEKMSFKFRILDFGVKMFIVATAIFFSWLLILALMLH